MHFHFEHAYIDSTSPIHALDARVKVVVAFLLILIIGLTPFGAFAIYLGFFALMMAGALAARVDPLLIIRRSTVAIPFALAAVSLIFTLPGPTLGTMPLTGWPISEPGLIRFISILLKSTLSVQAALLMMVTTQFTDMLWALGALKVPSVLVAIISFMYRYIFVLADESVRLNRARESRRAVLGKDRPIFKRLWFSAQTAGRMIGSLFLRGYDRSERVYMAMVSRGYNGEIKRMAVHAITPRDILFGIIPLIVGGALLAISLLNSQS